MAKKTDFPKVLYTYMDYDGNLICDDNMDACVGDERDLVGIYKREKLVRAYIKTKTIIEPLKK